MNFFFDDDGDFRFGGRTLYLLLHTNWLRYFRKNGKRCWKWTNETHWREDPNQRRYFMEVYGQASDGVHYYRTATASPLEVLISRGPTAEKKYFAEKRLDALEQLETFLNPDCRCRVGLHWKCGIHGTWRG